MPSPEHRRISDQERDAAGRRLAEAFADGRLGRAEHEARVAAVFGARTAGELEPLTADLEPYEPATAFAPPAARRRRHRLPGVLRVLWTLYAIGVAVNVVVYALVVVTTGHPVPPWPLWVAGPAGAVLVPLTLIVRRSGANPRPGPYPQPRSRSRPHPYRQPYPQPRRAAARYRRRRR